MPFPSPRMTREEAILVLQEYQRRCALWAKAAGLTSPLLAELFPKQQAFIQDPAREKALVGTRRGGKTFSLADYLGITASADPRFDCLYLNNTAKQAFDIMWEGPEGLKVMDLRHNLGIRFHNQKTIAYLPNGAKIICGGAENTRDIEQWRGRKFKLVIVDEAGSFQAHLEPLITSVLQPTTADFQGTLVLCGTPPVILAGMFYDAIREDEGRNKAWSLHSISILDNPYIPHGAEERERFRRVNKWDEFFEKTGQEHPTYRREWLGECVRETSTLVYRFPSDGRCLYGELPRASSWSRILGIDLGYSAPASFRVISFCDEYPDAYFGARIQKTGLNVSGIAEVIRGLERDEGDFIAMVCDAGGLGVTIVDELNDRHGFMIRAAEKSKKGSYIEVLNDDLLMGHIKVRADDPIIAEWAKLQWETEDRKQEDRRMPNHDADASLYAWRECKHYLHSDPVRVPRIGDKDFAAHEERRMEDLDIEQLTVKTDQPWWEQITS